MNPKSKTNNKNKNAQNSAVNNKASEENVKMYEKLEFESENGIEYLYILEQTTLGGVNYVLVTDDVESEDGECMIFKEVKIEEADSEYISYEDVLDEEELDAVFKIFVELNDDFDYNKE